MLPDEALKSMKVMFATPCYISAVSMHYVTSIFELTLHSARFGLQCILHMHSESLITMCLSMAQLSLLLCFFNLLPIPPLDGSQVVRSLIGMTYEAYYQIARYGFIIIILVWQIAAVQKLIGGVTNSSLVVIGHWFGMQVGA